MRRLTIAYMDNGLPVQMLSRRAFLFPDADEKHVAAVLAYIHDTDVETLNRLLYPLRAINLLARIACGTAMAGSVDGCKAKMDGKLCLRIIRSAFSSADGDAYRFRFDSSINSLLLEWVLNILTDSKCAMVYYRNCA